jgi:hypothetical protein
MRKLPRFVRLPNRWIEEGGLKALHWDAGEGADAIAGLMALAVIAHHADPETGDARLTYDEISGVAGVSRAKLSGGLKALVARRIVQTWADGRRGGYRLVGYDPERGWAKLPAAGLYHGGVITAFAEFGLRRRAELDALKLYYLFASRRDRERNVAVIAYPKIEDYTGVPRARITAARSLLSAAGLVYVEHVRSEARENGTAYAYRLAHLDPYRHAGTVGKAGEFFGASDAGDFDAAPADFR